MLNKEKIILGQFFTKEDLWLKPQVFDFIISKKCETAYDPFAGNYLLQIEIKACSSFVSLESELLEIKEETQK